MTHSQNAGDDESMHRLTFGQMSHVGQARQNNQDAAWSFVSRGDSAEGESDFGVFIVADGMGGHEHGERASAIAVRKVTSEILQRIFVPMMTGDDDMSPAFEALQNGVEKANEAILKEIPDGGTTIIATLIMGDILYIAHIGDSRAYLMTPESFDQVTEDHSMEQRLANLDALDPGEDFPMKNMLYRSLGLREDAEADTIRRRLPAQMTLLLCSDGLWNLVKDDEIESHLREADMHPQTICNKLVALANERGGHDNITVVIART